MDELQFDWLVPIGDAEALPVVRQCLESVLATMGPSDTCVVVCGPESWKQLDVHDSRFVRLDPPQTRSAAAWRNAALPRLASAYTIFQDADDIALPHRRELIVKGLQHGLPDVLIFGYEVIDELGRYKGTRVPKGGRNRFWFRTNAFLPTAVVRTSLLRHHQFREDLVLGEDTVLFGELLRAGARFAWHRDVAIKYRISRRKSSKKRGAAAIKSEIRFRYHLLNSARGIERILVCLGAVAAIAAKTLPAPIFTKLYSTAHSDS
ncbi:Glycosyltransferase involved in cell wall bisynthesis [Pelagibacterium halotolerans]|nr:glycosyltransferase [Pelagibacterium halotolerans]SEA88984.1 Glycosyltransferase involved in cell wall bisynthesis [Pelagibacterium halotolerans]